MATFDRFDICAAHYAWAVLNNGTDAAHRTFARLQRCKYQPGQNVQNLDLHDNALDIALELGCAYADVTRLVTCEPGTVSEGTLQTEDLLESFADALEWAVQDNAEHWCGRQEQRDGFLNLVENARECDGGEDSPHDPEELVEELTEALGYFAPAGYYFGAHPGDGADFGFWPSDRTGCPDCDDCAL